MTGMEGDLDRGEVILFEWASLAKAQKIDRQEIVNV
jgi:hypothetical protein